MKLIFLAFRSLFRKGGNNVIKIASLSVGLAAGLVLIAKVYFEQTYDDFFPDADRIYMICENFGQGVTENDELKQYPQVSGAIAHGMKAEVPEVETATSMTDLAFSDQTLVTTDRRKFTVRPFLADSFVFDVFPRRILAGDPKEVLAQPMYVMISRKIAERMGGIDAVMGQSFSFETYPGRTLTVGGVFEDLPLNSHMYYNVLVAMPSIGQFTYDGRNNWMGNDRYRGYVKLRSGTTPERAAPGIVSMQEKNLPQEEMKKAGIRLEYSLMPLLDIHSGTDEARRMAGMLSMLAFALIFTAVMNYVLIVISSLVGRSKEMAVKKCYGASTANIYARMLAETFADLCVSLLVAGMLVYAFRGTVQDLLGTDVTTLFHLRNLVLPAAVCIVVFFISSLVPGTLYARIPVASAFRNYRESKRFWKLGLLFLQITTAGFLLALLVIIVRQYAHMLKNDPGYSYENLAFTSLAGEPADRRDRVLEEIRRLPDVAGAAFFSETLLHHPSGNNVSLPDDDRAYFNATDLYSVGNGYLDLMEIPVVEGRSFTENVASSDEIMVSRSFAERISELAGWTDGAVGKRIRVSEHSDANNISYTICGVFENVRIGAIGREDQRPQMLFYSNLPTSILLVKYHRQTPETNRLVTETLRELMPDRDVVLYSYPTEMTDLYTDTRKFRDAVMIGSILTLVITLIGLVGYTRDEINRRRKEIAIRKINGATLASILRMFVADINRIAIPALVAGTGIAAWVSFRWQMQFTEKSVLSPLVFVACAVTVMLVVLAAVTINCYRAANENPAVNIKSE
jgi:putative ABC transport system permease protein